MTKTKRTGVMVLGILFIGLCVSFLRLSRFGVDPFSAMNLGISGFIGWSFGTWQLLVNAIILVVVFFQQDLALVREPLSIWYSLDILQILSVM